MIPFNQTKIICTIGPGSNNLETMKGLVNAGMDVMRMNFSHGSYEDHGNELKLLKQVNKDLNTHIAALLDTKGPEIRTHKFENGKVQIEEGSRVTIHMNEILGNEKEFSVNYAKLANDVVVGDTILVDDGYLELKVVDIHPDDTITTLALNTHVVKDRRGINVPGVKLHLDFISEKDREDIMWGCKNKVDFIAASFVRRATDVLEIRDILKKQGDCHIQIISKIENKEGVDNIDEIIEVSDGIMVARGDLGVEVPAEDVPIIQKMIIEKCHSAGKISVTATQMLESMIEHPRPTRAEVSDVANAIYDGTDAIMLSGESAIGKYPIESVRTMNRIASKIESQLDRKNLVKRANEESKHTRAIETSIAISVAYTVIQSKVDLIITPTMSGNTAKIISKFRPNAKIVALCPNETIAHGLALHNGVDPVVFPLEPNTESVIKNAIAYIKKEHGIVPGNRVIITGGFPIGSPTNGMRIIDIT